MASADAAVVSRQETINYRYVSVSAPSHQTSLKVRFQPPGLPNTIEDIVAVDVATYDRIGPGTTIPIRYLPQFPWIARSAQATSFTFLQPLLDLELIASLVGVLITVGVVLLIARFAGSGLVEASIALSLAWIIIASIVVVTRPLRADRALPLDRQAVAKVLSVVRVNSVLEVRSNARIPMIQPFDLAIIQFVPPGFDHPVKSWDEVDAGSMPSLTQGATVPIQYSSVNPRHAQIVGGTRRAVWINGLPGVGLVATTLVLLCIMANVIRRRRARKLTVSRTSI